MKWMVALLLVIGSTSCKPEHEYSGDGALTVSHGILWNPIYKIQLPEIDISKPHVEKYDLNGLSPSKVYYGFALEVPSSGEITPSRRNAWGKCKFVIKKNGTEILTSSTEFCKMENCLSSYKQGKDNKIYFSNELYIMGAHFMVPNDQDHFELIFECSGFDSPEPIWAHILLRSGGE